MPKLGAHDSAISRIVRSMRSHALVHSLAQTWTQIGRNPAAALGNIAPNIGSVVAIEKDKRAHARADLPDVPGAEFRRRGGRGISARGRTRRSGSRPATGGIANTTNPDGQTHLQQPLEADALAGRQSAREFAQRQPMDDYNDFYTAAKGMMYNPVVNQAFGFTAADSARYGSTSTGQCLPGGPPGAEGQPGHALHPDHLQRRLGHAPEHLRRQQRCPPRARFWTTAVSQS